MRSEIRDIEREIISVSEDINILKEINALTPEEVKDVISCAKQHTNIILDNLDSYIDATIRKND